MPRVCVVTAAIWCRLAATTLAAALAATPLYAAEPEKTAKRAGKFVEKTAKRAIKFTKKTAQKTADWVKRQTE
jgi:hypothetical protein